MMLRQRLTLVTAVAGLAGTPAATLAQSPSAQGESLFRARCGACHSLEPGQNRIGPNLASLAGRAAGSVEGARYSAGLQESDIVWNAETLDSYLASPRQTVPGTTMAVGLPNPAQREAIIGYLLAETGQ